MNTLKRFVSCAALSAVTAMSIVSVLPQANGGTPMLQASAASKTGNPVIWSDVPDSDVIRVGDTYYMVSTTMFFSPGAPIMKSNDLVSWEICGYVYDRLADGDVQNLTNGKHDYAHGQWAASLRYNEKNGKFYVFFGSYGTGKSYIYSTDDIENGEWSKVELNGMYHDASILFDDDGRNYLVYGGGEIKIKEFNSDMTGFKQGGVDKTLFKTNITGYVAGEGSHIQKIGDYYYIFIIAWPSGTGRVEICYRSKDLLGNYESKTVLDSGLGSYNSGVAQGGIVQTPNGDWYGLLFQDHGAVGRIPVLVPVTWQDNWPIMGVNGKAPLTLNISGDGTDLAGDDSFDYSDDELALEWQWNHNPDNNSWSVTERDGWLRLHNNNMASHILNAKNTLTMRTEGPACSSYIKLDTKGMKVGDYAGLSAFQLNFGNIGVYVADDGSKKIYMAKNGGDSIDTTSNKIIAEQNLQGDEVYLKVDFKFATVGSDGSSSNNIDKANFYYSYDGSSWTKLGEELSMTYDLKLFTGYRSAIYSYPTKNKGGYADIDFFEYDRQSWNGADGSKKLGSTANTSVPDENGHYFYHTFENGTEKWEGRGSAKVEKSSKAKYNGSSSLYCSGREAAWNGATYTLNSKTFKAGQEYSFSVNVMYDEGNSDYELFYLTLQYDDADGVVNYDKIAKGTISKGKWLSLSNTNYKLPENSSNYHFYVETDNSKTSFYVDDAIGAEAGSKIEAAPKASELAKGDINCDGCIDVFDLIEARKGLDGGFTNAMFESAADVDNSGVFELSDAELIQDFILGKIKEFPDNTPPEPEVAKFNYNPEIQVQDAPAEYLEVCSQAGKVTKETYNGIRGTKSLNVYTPYNYDPSKKYNIFYLMHGGSENENTIFSDDVKLNRILDHMIMKGELEPLIVVTPTFNGQGSEAANFYQELRESVIPFVEGKYSTYANSTSEADIRASRMHRAYGGFSMGALSTWCTADHDMDIVGYFMPLSGNNWEGMDTLTKEIDSLGFTQRDYFIFAATGDGDLAYPNMKPEMEDLKTRTKYFTYTSDFSKGNFYFMVAPGRTHWWGAVRHYIYDALPYFFHEGQ
ncbi:MAG: family 43 glycosylhydrolase [Ruminococcus sp.]|nr:family 43 glycosylhydrolase [Ruminococcus sp.]